MALPALPPPVKRALAAGATSAAALAVGLVAYFEGTKPEAYLDPVGIPTICTGHTDGVVMGQVRSLNECAALLQADLDTAMAHVLALTRVPLSGPELAAYTSFVYNLGYGNFARSTLLRKLNSGDRVGACAELPRWNKAGGRVLPGLVKRRAAERELCLMGVSP